MDLITEFLQKLNGLSLQPGEPIIVGVSGGADSLVLLHLFSRARDYLDIQPYAVHLNHGIRGTEADDDARVVADIAQEWGIPCTIEKMDVPEIADERRLSIEEAARQARYTVLDRHSAKTRARYVAVGHNADDQAETVLMHLLRGAGLVGLRGMLEQTPISSYHLLEERSSEWRTVLFRPLLNVPRSDIEAYCIKQGLKPSSDSTNHDMTYFRNQLRHEIIPILESVNPNLRVSLTRTASVLAAYYDVLKQQVDEACNQIRLSQSKHHVTFSLEKWRALPLAMQRATIRRTVRRLNAYQRDVSYQHVDNAVNVAMSRETGAQVSLPGGVVLRVGYDVLEIAAPEHAPREPDWPLLTPGVVVDVKDLGEYALPGSDWVFSLQVYDGPREGEIWESLINDPWITPLDASLLSEPIQLRTRLPGDRFFPMGTGGTQKISIFMINEKIPVMWRDRLPIMTVGELIAWMCGWRIDERFAVRPNTGQVWLAGFRPAQSEL